MTIRDLSRPQRRLMDAFLEHPDWSNDQLAHALGCSVAVVEKHFKGVFQLYRVQSRTGAFAEHARRHPLPKRRRPVTQAESLELC